VTQFIPPRRPKLASIVSGRCLANSAPSGPTTKAPRKQFFFEEKNQKSFIRFAPMLLVSATSAMGEKVFVFSKKKFLLLRRCISLNADWYK
jgi:hypothetical protein